MCINYEKTCDECLRLTKVKGPYYKIVNEYYNIINKKQIFKLKPENNYFVILQCISLFFIFRLYLNVLFNCKFTFIVFQKLVKWN